MAEQIICFVDQQLGPNVPFDPQIDYCSQNNNQPPPTITQCSDGIDNDGDGLVDLADPDCDSAQDNTESGSMGTTTGTTTPTQCADTIDNDSDGLIDLADPDCTNAQDNTESGTMGTTTGTTTDNGGDNGTTTDAALMVTSVDALKTTAIADDNYADGWQYLFHITAPNGEPNLSMKFSDWFVSSSSSSTIPAANNMRISSGQSSTTQPITITAANAYSTPALIMTGDLDPNAPGRQVNVLVEVKIPVGTNNDTYTTNYGVQTLP
jgi:hypothetical protein